MTAKLESPRGQTRTKPMKLLCLGLSRSGTESLCKALEILDIPTYHGWRSMENHAQSELWIEALAAKYENKGKTWKREDFDQILGGYSACTDFPSAAFPLELIHAYPEAKVILNQRPVGAWFQSTMNTAGALTSSWLYWVLMNLDSESRAIYRCWRGVNMHYFRHDMARNAKDVYAEHGALVRGAAKCADSKGNFLEYDPSQGWEPLCRFLDVPIPKEEFPRGNVADEFHKRVEESMKPRFLRGVRNLVLTSAMIIGAGVWGYMHRGEAAKMISSVL